MFGPDAEFSGNRNFFNRSQRCLRYQHNQPSCIPRYHTAMSIEKDDPDMLMTNDRTVLPNTRKSITHKFQIAGHEGYLTIGLFEDGSPGELFIKMSKEGSTLSGLIQGFCRAFSLSLQYGLPIEDAVERFRGMRFEPMGLTNNPDVPEASSILDYVARYLEVTFVK